MINRPTQSLTLHASGAETASGNSGAVLLPSVQGQIMLVEVNVSAASGTTPTLDLYFQESLDNGATFKDVAHFTQITTTTASPVYLKLGLGNNAIADAVVGAIGDATVAAGSLGLPVISGVLRLKWVIGGTTPSFTFASTAYIQ